MQSLSQHIKDHGDHFCFIQRKGKPEIVTCRNGHSTFKAFHDPINKTEFYLRCTECGDDTLLVVVSVQK